MPDKYDHFEDFDYEVPDDDFDDAFNEDLTNTEINYPKIYFMDNRTTTDPAEYREWYDTEGKYQDDDYWIMGGE